MTPKRRTNTDPPARVFAEKRGYFSFFLLIAAIAIAIPSTLVGAEGKKEERTAVTEATCSVENFGKVTEGYYRGAQPERDEYSELSSLGVKTIVDLRNDPKSYAKTLAERAGMKYINLPMSDKDYPSQEAADAFLKIVNAKENQPVFVHCAGGRHRTGAMTAVYRMTMQGWDVDRAYSEMKDYDFYTRWGHKAMKRYVFDYYRGLQQRREILQIDSTSR